MNYDFNFINQKLKFIFLRDYIKKILKTSLTHFNNKLSKYEQY